MPIYKYLENKDSSCLVYYIQESVDYFLDKFSEKDLEYIKKIKITHSRRYLEHVVGYFCIKEITNKCNVKYDYIYKDSLGKPYLYNSNAFISVSHSYPLVVVGLDTKKSIGVDIQKIEPKICSLQEKFLGKEEQSYIPKNSLVLSVCFSLKEAIYKMFGQKINIKEDISVCNFEFLDSEVDVFLTNAVNTNKSNFIYNSKVSNIYNIGGEDIFYFKLNARVKGLNVEGYYSIVEDSAYLYKNSYVICMCADFCGR